MNHSLFLEQAYSLARSAWGRTAPNPPVGALIIREGKILGTGVHLGPGEPHAEAAALEDLKSKGYSPVGATLYVSLEPCCHEGPGKRTPPCAQRIIKEGLTHVVIGCLDPNPAVAGKGAVMLREAGIKVTLAEDTSEALDLIKEFQIWILEKRATIHLKWAQTLDGQLAAKDKSSRWITCAQAREEAHRLRALHHGVLIGSGTLRDDNPSLLPLNQGVPWPARFILSGEKALPEASKIFTDDYNDQTWVIATPGSLPWEQAQSLVPGRVVEWEMGNWAMLTKKLFDLGFYSLLVEGGAEVHNSLLRAGFWDRISVFIAPKILGAGKNIPGNLGRDTIAQALELTNLKIKTYGSDFLLSGIQEGTRCLQV